MPRKISNEDFRFYPNRKNQIESNFFVPYFSSVLILRVLDSGRAGGNNKLLAFWGDAEFGVAITRLLFASRGDREGDLSGEKSLLCSNKSQQTYLKQTCLPNLRVREHAAGTIFEAAFLFSSRRDQVRSICNFFEITYVSILEIPTHLFSRFSSTTLVPSP